METTTLPSQGQPVSPKQVCQQANVATVDDVAGCLASASRRPQSEAQAQAAIKARLKAEDAATMPRGTTAGSRRKALRVKPKNDVQATTVNLFHCQIFSVSSV